MARLQTEKDRQYRQHHRRERLQYNRAFRLAHLELSRKWARDYITREIAKNPRWKREQTLKHRHGMSLAQWDAMMEKQQGVCAICGRTSRRGSLVVDHDHKTNRVRGLLCHNCNLTLGKMEDNSTWLLAAAKYLQESKVD